MMISIGFSYRFPPWWPTPAKPSSAAAILWLARLGKHEEIPHPKGVEVFLT